MYYEMQNFDYYEIQKFVERRFFQEVITLFIY